MNIAEYIRTPFGITKCRDKHQIIIEDDLFGETKYGYLYYLEDYDDEICNITDSNLDEYKHSPNIIDLIEEGDYVDDYYIEENKGNYLLTNELDYEMSSIGKAEYVRIFEKEIKTIVTKEQFESMKYRIGE